MALAHPCYVLIGSEPVRRRHLLARLSGHAADVERFSAAKSGPLDVWQPSLLADPDRPLLRVVTEYPKWTPAQRKQFAAACAAPVPGICCVVLCDKLGAKDALRGAVPDEALISMEAPKPGEFADWCMRQARLAGAQMDSAAARKLVARAGERTEALASEIEKLTVASSGEPITEQLVGRLVAAEQQTSSWAWADAVIARDRRSAVAALAEAELAGQQPLALTGVLHGRLLNIAWVHAGVRAEQVAAKPYPFKLAAQAARSDWPKDRAVAALRALCELEAGLKGGCQLNAWTQLARFSAQTASTRSSPQKVSRSRR